MILALIACAFLCFLLAAVGVSVAALNLTALGLACWMLSLLVGAWQRGQLP